ncbi:hypothetical protein CgunFtcFv8_012598 [Champsocephalus gunnari]|uniref:Uncharacterized protein n=1 Tax=Champsocephalus gunnari TaxID=52237 RepID=A0AAN8HSU6_CHAGU|nr:hypothetical protein CgunFtcFv8_012598 [Champsocephalus gunnari]
MSKHTKRCFWDTRGLQQGADLNVCEKRRDRRLTTKQIQIDQRGNSLSRSSRKEKRFRSTDESFRRRQQQPT